MTATSDDRVRALTLSTVNRRIDAESEQRLAASASLPEAGMRSRISRLDREWDFERVLESEAALTGLIGVALAAARGRAWLLMPGVAGVMILVHALFGPYPLLPLFRRLGIRTRDEIDNEKYALKALRGDFAGLPQEDRIARATAAWRAVQL